MITTLEKWFLMPTFLKNDLCGLSIGKEPVCLAALCLLLAVGCAENRFPAPEADAQAALQIRATLESVATTQGSQAAAATGTGWGTLTGRFIFAGTSPTPKALVIDKDTEVCAKGGMQLVDRSLLVDPSTKGLANVVVFARKTTRVKEALPPEAPLMFDQKQCEFMAPVFAARVGQPIDVHNSDPIGHNTNISGSSFNQLIPSGQGTIYKPAAETGLPTMVTCNIHPWMKCYAVFRKDGYVAVSGADGSFTIPALPAGEAIEFQVWHERATGPSGALGLEKKELKWTPKGRFQIQLEPDEVKDIGAIDVPVSAIGI